MKINKSQIKRNKTNVKSKLNNNYFETRIRTLIKKIKIYCEEKKIAEAEKEKNKLFSFLDKSKKRKMHNTNFVSRKKSNIQKRINLLNSKPELKVKPKIKVKISN